MKYIPPSWLMDFQEITICPYCMQQREEHGEGCCGESSAHFETAYLINGEIVLKEELEKIYTYAVMKYVIMGTNQ